MLRGLRDGECEVGPLALNALVRGVGGRVAVD